MVEGGRAGVDYPLPAGPSDCTSSSSIEADADVLSEEDDSSLPFSLSSLEEASSSELDAISTFGYSAFNVVAVEA